MKEIKKTKIILAMLIISLIAMTSCAVPIGDMDGWDSMFDFERDLQHLIRANVNDAYAQGLINCIEPVDGVAGVVYCEEPTMPELTYMGLEDITQELIIKAKGFEMLPDEARAYSAQELRHYAKERAERIKDLMEENLTQALQYIIPEDVRVRLPNIIREYIEEDVELTGTLSVLHLDDFDEGTSDNKYYLDVNQQILRLISDIEELEYLSTALLRVKGLKIEEYVAVEEAIDETVEVLQAPAMMEVTDNRKVAVILINFEDTQNAVLTPISTIRGGIFTDSNSANAFLQENSFNEIGLTGRDNVDGDIYGWYDIPYSRTLCEYSNYRALATAAREAAEPDGFVYADYDHVMYLFPRQNNCGYGGLGMLRGKETWINGYHRGIIIHELGHNFGFHHATSYRCVDSQGNRVALSGQCTISEYGDVFDVMGNAVTTPRHFNNYFKQSINWITQDKIQNINAPGVYTLRSPQYENEGPKILRIAREQETSNLINYLYVEYRRPYGFDSWAQTSPAVNGVMLRLAPLTGYSRKTHLIDTTPETTTFADAPLQIGNVFEDPLTGIYLQVLALNDDYATIEVSFEDDFEPICVRGAPTLTKTPSNHMGYAGDEKTYTLSIKNEDSSACNVTEFIIEITKPEELILSTQTMNLELAPGATATRTFQATPTNEADAGSYSITTKLVHTQTNATATRTSTYTVLEEDTTPPTITILSPNDGETVTRNFRIDTMITDDTGIAQATILLNGNVIQECFNIRNGRCRTNVNIRTVNNGANTITVTAIDSSENSNEATKTITINR